MSLNRTVKVLTETDPEITTFQKLVIPVLSSISVVRSTTAMSQFDAGIIPNQNAETPDFGSRYEPEILSKSFNPIVADSIKLLTVLYTIGNTSTYYFYTLNRTNVVHVYEHKKFMENRDNIATINKTDFVELKQDEETDLRGVKFYKSYINSFNPNTETTGFGINAVCMNGTMNDLSQDSIVISKSLAAKLTSIKYIDIKVVNALDSISLNKDFKLEIGEPIDSRIIFSIDKENMHNTVLAAKENTYTSDVENFIGHENSIIDDIAVFSNKPLKNKKLEEHRLRCRKIRDDFTAIVDEIQSKGYKLSDELAFMNSNYRGTNYRSGDKIVENTMILKVMIFDEMHVGCKLTTLSGEKYTVVKIVDDDHLVDQFGNKIEATINSVSKIGRSIAEPLLEINVTNYVESIRRYLKSGEISEEKAYEMLCTIYNTINGDDVFYNGTKEDIPGFMEFFRHNRIKITSDTLSNTMNIPNMSRLLMYMLKELAHTDFQDGRRLIYQNPTYNLDGTISHSINEANCLKRRHEVGTLFFYRLKQEPFSQTQAVGTQLYDIKNIAIDNNSSDVKNGTSRFKEQGVKIDLQSSAQLANKVPHKLIAELYNVEQRSYGIHEILQSIGVDLRVITDEDNDEE